MSAAAPTSPPAPSPGTHAAVRPHRELAVFLVVTGTLLAAATSIAVVEGVDVRHIGDASPLGMAVTFGGALWPLVGVVAARRVVRRPLADPRAGWRRPGWRPLARALLTPLALIGVATAVAVLTGLAGLPAERLPAVVGLGLASVVAFVPLALPEDLAWQGVVRPWLLQWTTPRRAALLTGLLWSATHWPMMLFLHGTPDGVAVPVAIAGFTASITAVTVLMAELVDRSRSLWPAVAFHAAWNSLLYAGLETRVVDTGATAWWVGETGILLALVTVGWTAWRARARRGPAAAYAPRRAKGPRSSEPGTAEIA